MNNNTRLIVNTLAQNVRAIINIVLSLYSTRIAMQALGLSDYGICMLVAGIVSLLSYVSNTLIVTTQRFLSYATGANNHKETRSVFANSYIIHWILGFVLAVFFLLLTPWFFGGFLNIPADKISESKVVYYFVTTTVLLTFISSPFRALLISHENIVYISIVDVLDGILKLALVFSLFLVDSWRLPLYAMILASVMLFNLVMLAGYSHLHYKECILIPNPKALDWNICRKLTSFATWTIYGMSCTYARAQGIAIILNRAISTLANAAYGIATQVYGSVQFLSSAISNAIAPQIIKAEGNGNRSQAIHLTFIASKYGFLLLALASIPIIAEMPSLLRLWLHEEPDNAVFFCRMMLIVSLCDQTTISLGILNQAIGRIREYMLVTFTIKMLCIPISILCLYFGMEVSVVMYSYLIFEIIAAFIRIPFLIYTAGMTLRDFIQEVLLRILFPTLTMLCATWVVCNFIPTFYWRFIITVFFTFLCGTIAIWFTAMNPSERHHIRSLIINHLHYDQS